jgi:hypothetical protein
MHGYQKPRMMRDEASMPRSIIGSGSSMKTQRGNAVQASRKIHVYGMVDPRTKEIRYVGQSDNIKRRYGAHLKASHSIGLKSWIDDLTLEGENPLLIILETAEMSEASARELHWIETLRSQGHRLINSIRPMCLVNQRKEVPEDNMTEVKLTLRLPSTLHKALEQMAEAGDRSINAQIVHLLRQATKAQQGK